MVGDEPQVLRYLQNSLNSARCQVVVTSDSSEVIGLIETDEPELVLLDAVLPGASGFDVLRQIRRLSGVPVIFLSARERE